MTSELQLDHHIVQTHDMFRAAGFTLAAIQYPLSEAAVAWLLKFNGAPDGWKSPHAWRYAPNQTMRETLERNAVADSPLS
jgi:hypothetical protein